MKISLKWLGELVDTSEAGEVARRLTMGGLEVEGIERPHAALEGVVVAQILSSEKHPNADSLSVTRVDAGGEAPLQIVCGAKNYQVGDKVPLATVGTRLPGAKEPIGDRPLRGVASKGMLCSARELGLSDDHGGLLILPGEAAVGAPVARVLELEDAILELNVTPNRGDALSHLGVARDLGAVSGVPLKAPPPPPGEDRERAASRVSVHIEDPSRCVRYAARVVEGLTVKPSPGWMQRRLAACGVRAINNLVDVGNYVMLELGQPLHAFDLDRIGGQQIVVRTARPGERLVTLDGKDRALDREDLLICDRDRPLVLAGIMGGESSEVTLDTTRVLIEAACFAPWTIRRSSKRHQLRSESSYRFERGVDVAGIVRALDRAAALMAELGGGRVLGGVVDAYPAVVQPRTVRLRYRKVDEVLGAPVPPGEVDRVLTALGLEAAEPGEEATTWRVPLARQDLAIEEDLVEEVARIRGYDQVPVTLPRGMPALSPEPAKQAGERSIRRALGGQGLDEVVNYSFVPPAWLAAMEAAEGAIHVANPLSVEQSVMRTTLLPSLVNNVALSARYQAAGVQVYELARTYRARPDGGRGQVPVADERLEVAGALYGLSGKGRSWTRGARAVDFYDAKAAVEAVLEALHVAGVTYRPLTSPWFHPRAAASVVSADGVVLGTVGELHPRAMKAMEAPAGVFLFQLEVDRLLERGTLVPQGAALPRYPTVPRDLAVVVELTVEAAAVRDIILDVGRPLVEDAVVFDVYQGPQVGPDRKNLAFALTYRAADRTLTDAEVTAAHARIVDEVRRRLGGTLRS